MKHFTRIVRVGYLASDTLTERKDGEFTKRDVREDYSERYVKTFAECKEAFVDMQRNVDVLIVGNNAGIAEWDDGAAQRFTLANTRIPTGCLLDWMTPVSFLGATRRADEQGAYAAKAALKILGGAFAGDIPIVRNSQADIIINMKIANQLGLKIPKSFRKLHRGSSSDPPRPKWFLAGDCDAGAVILYSAKVLFDEGTNTWRTGGKLYV